MVLRKKKSAILNGVWFESIIYRVLTEENLALCKIIPIKSLIFGLDSVQKRRIFFFLATLRSPKIVKERAYIPTSFLALLKAHFFNFVYFFNLCVMNFYCVLKNQ